MSLKEIKGKQVSSWIRYKLIWNSPLVFIVFFGIDFLYYGIIHPSGSYANDLVHKIIWMAILALVYTHAYHKASYGWWLTNWVKIKVKYSIASNAEFMAKDKAEQSKLEKEHFSSNMWSSIYFGFLMGLVFIAIIALSGYIVSVIYIYGLGAIRGIPESGADDAVLVVTTVIAGATLEICGREESGDVRDP